MVDKFGQVLGDAGEPEPIVVARGACRETYVLKLMLFSLAAEGEIFFEVTPKGRSRFSTKNEKHRYRLRPGQYTKIGMTAFEYCTGDGSRKAVCATE